MLDLAPWIGVAGQQKNYRRNWRKTIQMLLIQHFSTPALWLMTAAGESPVPHYFQIQHSSR
jgi:hypothetical protein